MMPPELIEVLKSLPQDKAILCQVVGEDGSAWNMRFVLAEGPKTSGFNVLTVSHPQLKSLNPLTIWENDDGTVTSRWSCLEEHASNVPQSYVQEAKYGSGYNEYLDLKEFDAFCERMRPIFEAGMRGELIPGSNRHKIELDTNGRRYSNQFVENAWYGFLLAAELSDHIHKAKKVLENDR